MCKDRKGGFARKPFLKNSIPSQPRDVKGGWEPQGGTFQRIRPPVTATIFPNSQFLFRSIGYPEYSKTLSHELEAEREPASRVQVVIPAFSGIHIQRRLA